MNENDLILIVGEDNNQSSIKVKELLDYLTEELADSVTEAVLKNIQSKLDEISKSNSDSDKTTNEKLQSLQTSIDDLITRVTKLEKKK